MPRQPNVANVALALEQKINNLARNINAYFVIALIMPIGVPYSFNYRKVFQGGVNVLMERKKKFKKLKLSCTLDHPILFKSN